MHRHKLQKLLSSSGRATSHEALLSASNALFEAIDTPRSLAAYLLLKEGEFAQLVNLDINPDLYSTAEQFAGDYLVTKFLSKYPDFVHTDLDPKKAALSSFHESEEACRKTNERFKSLDLDPSLWDPLMLPIFRLAKRKIRSVLKKPDLVKISSKFGWGPGATSAASGKHTSAYIKFKARLDVTSNCLVMGHCCVNSTPAWVNCQSMTDEFPSVAASLTREAFNIIRGDEIVFVPKTAKTLRVICKGPHVNTYVQTGFGKNIRELLRHAGVDLSDQTRNQRLAKLGSLHGELATMDLKAASDTISRELVRYLLDPEWYSLLDQIRCKQGFLREENTWIHYQKFSSMGNGCTFELESLIFWALCKSCLEINGGEQTLSVYGDDLIVPTVHYESVAKVLGFAGFSLNTQKSFSTGRFRESCGADYFDGVNVRPIFLKKAISNAESLFKLANSIRRYAHIRNSNYGCDRRFLATWQVVCDRIPEPLRNLKIPEGFGDSGLLSNFDEACPSRPKNGWGGYLFKGLVRLPLNEAMRDRHAGYTANLSVIGAQQGVSGYEAREFNSLLFRNVSKRDTTAIDAYFSDLTPSEGRHDLRKATYPKIARLHTHSWYDLGSWNN